MIRRVGGSFHSAPDAPGHLPGGIQSLLRKGKIQEWGQGTAACLVHSGNFTAKQSDDKVPPMLCFPVSVKIARKVSAKAGCMGRE